MYLLLLQSNYNYTYYTVCLLADQLQQKLFVLVDLRRLFCSSKKSAAALALCICEQKIVFVQIEHFVINSLHARPPIATQFIVDTLVGGFVIKVEFSKEIRDDLTAQQNGFKGNRHSVRQDRERVLRHARCLAIASRCRQGATVRNANGKGESTRQLTSLTNIQYTVVDLY
jgi:hypothetical protein